MNDEEDGIQYARKFIDDPESELWSRELAARSLIDFTTYTNDKYIPEDFHVHLANQLDLVVSGDIDRMIVIAPPQNGKLMADDTPILTLNGWKQHGEILPRDFVFDEKGLPIKVLALSSETMGNCMVEFSDGSSIQCHENHEWIVHDTSLNHSNLKVLETKEIEAFGIWTGKSGLRRKLRFELYDTKHRKIVSITRCNPKPGHCIQVEGGIYLVGKTLIPTHNSELTSVRLPAYWFARQPNYPVLLCSYGASLAWEFSGLVWNTVYSQDYMNLFPNLFSPKLNRRGPAHKLVLKHSRSKLYPAGTRGPITGRGGMLGIIDDPFKDEEDAYNPRVREKVWNWWKGTFRPRIWTRGRILLVNTRWHEDDLTGRILNQSGEKWTVLRYPAIAETDEERAENRKYLGRALELHSRDPLGREPGFPLCPIRYPLQALLDIRHDIGPRPWSAEYQGTPRPIEGNRIKQEHIHIVKEWPRDEIVKIIRFWDKAGTDSGGARTAGVLLATTKNRTYYIINMVKGQWSPFEREEVMKQTALRDEAEYNGKVETWFEIEPGSEGKFGAAFTMRNMAGYNIRPDRPSASKEVRFEPFANQMEAGNVFILQAEWTWELVDELLMFPASTYKDQVDALSGAFKKSVASGWSRGPGSM